MCPASCVKLKHGIGIVPRHPLDVKGKPSIKCKARHSGAGGSKGQTASRSATDSKQWDSTVGKSAVRTRTWIDWEARRVLRRRWGKPDRQKQCSRMTLRALPHRYSEVSGWPLNRFC